MTDNLPLRLNRDVPKVNDGKIPSLRDCDVTTGSFFSITLVMNSFYNAGFTHCVYNSCLHNTCLQFGSFMDFTFLLFFCFFATIYNEYILLKVSKYNKLLGFPTHKTGVAN